MERIALEVRHLQRAEVGEAYEPFARAQKGSSAMPHKRNPITAERICGLARVIRSHADVALQDIALSHERDISHSSAERVIVPDAFILTDYLLDRTTWLVAGLDVREDRMLANVASQRGLVASQRVLLALVESGMERDVAYREVQGAVAKVYADADLDLAAALQESEVVTAAISTADVRAWCDPATVPAGVAAIFSSLPSD